MGIVDGYAGSVAGSSGSVNALEAKSGWSVYVLPRGAFASAASTGVLISVDSNDERNRYAATDWIQIGTDTAKIRQVANISSASTVEVTSAVTVSQNDRILLIGSTQPTVTGGSASYQPRTTIYPRGNTISTPVTNSKLTTSSSGNYQFFAVDALYDLLVQDANNSNQGILVEVPVGLARGGDLIADAVNTRDLGSAGVPWNDVHFAGSIISGVSNASGSTVFHFEDATGITQGNLFDFELNNVTKVYGDTYGGIHESWTIPRVVNVKSARFGAKGDNSTIDTTAIADGITFARSLVSGSQGGKVYLPKGTYLIDSTLVFPEGVDLVGEGSRATIIKAHSTFPTNTPLIRIGDGSDSTIHSVSIQDVAIDCNNISGSIGVYSTDAQEETGVRNCIIANFKSAGIFFSTPCQNTRVMNSSLFHTSTTATGISYNTVASKNVIYDVSITSNDGTVSTLSGVGTTSTQLHIHGLHVESFLNGIYYGVNSSGSIIGGEGHTTVTNLIRLDDEGVVCLANSPSGATNLVWDSVYGITLTSSDFISNTGGWYMSSNDSAVGATRSIWTSSTRGTNQVNPNTVFGGTVSFASGVPIKPSVISSQEWESVAAATSITVSKNRVALTGAGAVSINSIAPTSSAYDGMEVFFINEGSDTFTFNNATGGGNIDNDQNLNIAIGVQTRITYTLRGGTWYQSSSRILSA